LAKLDRPELVPANCRRGPPESAIPWFCFSDCCSPRRSRSRCWLPLGFGAWWSWWCCEK